jgi:hypothetical protein
MIPCLVRNELGRIWKEAAVAQFVDPSRDFPGKSEENHEYFLQVSLSADLYLNSDSS